MVAAVVDNVNASLRRLAQNLCMRPNWRGNYKSLSGIRDPDDKRIELSLLLWLKTECAMLRPEEIDKAMLTLVTRTKFAPDTNDIIRVIFHTAAVNRFGDERAVYEAVVAKATRWLQTGHQEQWTPAEAYLVKRIGVRKLCESGLDQITERITEVMMDFVRLGEPDVRDEKIFDGSTVSYVGNYAGPRPRHDFTHLRSMMQRMRG